MAEKMILKNEGPGGIITAKGIHTDSVGIRTGPGGLNLNDSGVINVVESFKDKDGKPIRVSNVKSGKQNLSTEQWKQAFTKVFKQNKQQMDGKLKAAGVRPTLQPSLIIETFEDDWDKQWFLMKLLRKRRLGELWRRHVCAPPRMCKDGVGNALSRGADVLS